VPACPKCGKQWPDGYAICPDDGLRLSIGVSGATAAASTGALALAMARGNDDLAPGTVAGEYVIESKLGQGGMGAVYGARHPLIGKRAAIKVISRDLSASQEAVDRFVREAQAVNQIGHPNIVDVFGFGRLPDGRSFFVMEWLVGETLRSRMLRPLALGEALELLDQIATALEAAHEAGVLHRDLKPDNVFLVAHKGSKPTVKLLDFGLAKLQGGGDGRIDHTRTGVVMGTPLYLSPEQAKGVQVAFPADIYSLGAVAYEMCAGKVPFLADSAVEIMAKHISERAVPMFQIAPHTPLALDGLVADMMEKDPARRPTIADVRTRLAAIRAQPLPTAGPTVALSQQQAAVATPLPTGSSAIAAVPLVASMAPNDPPRHKRRGLIIGLALAGALAAGTAAYALVIGFGDRGEHLRLPTANERELSTQATVADEEQKTKPQRVVVPSPSPSPSPSPAPSPAPTPTKKPEPVAKKPDPPKATTGTLVVHIIGAPHGRVYLDGKQVATAITEWKTELPPGDHRVRAFAPPRKASELEKVTIAAGKEVDITLDVRPRSSSMDRDNE
jgi:serine/threonine-protein kinase